MSWMSDIFESLLEEPLGKKKFVHLHSLKSIFPCNFLYFAEPPVQCTSFVAKLGKVKRTLLFAVILNDKDGNHLINHAWIPFWHVVLALLPHMNSNSLLDNIDIYLRKDLVSTKLSTLISKSCDYQ